jgi:F420-dependent oxidoreductase-like protein
MRTSVFHFLNPNAGAPVADYIEDLRGLREQGFDTIWSPQLPWDPDTMTAMAIALRELDGITLGTSVVPIQNRHPMALAQTALTLSSLSGSRFRLGIGLTHAMVTEDMWGIPWDRPVRRLTEYLDGLLPLLAGQKADAGGELYTTRGQLAVAGASPPPVYVAALGPQLLRIAGRRVTGTITWMTGARTLAGHVVPTLRRAAAQTGAPGEVVTGLPVCVTDDLGAVRQLAAREYAIYGTLPSYRAMLDREGLDGPAEVALIGDEDTVAARLAELESAGVTEFSATVFGRGDEDRARTLAFLRARS